MLAHGVNPPVQGTVDEPSRALGRLRRDALQHADHRRQADAAADQNHRLGALPVEEEVARGCGDLQHSSGLRFRVQPVRDEAGRMRRCGLALDGDAVGAIVRCAGDRVVPLQHAPARQVDEEAEILPRLVTQHWAAVSWDQHERADRLAFRGDALDHEVAPAVPSTGLGRLIPVDRRLAADQQLRQEPVRLAPGRDDLRGRGLAEHIADRREQGVGDVRIMLRQDVERDMLLGDALHRARQHAEVVDVAGIGQNGEGEGLGLRAGFAVMRLVEEVADLHVLEQALVHAPGDGEPVRFESRDGGFDGGDGLGRERCGHRRIQRFIQHESFVAAREKMQVKCTL